MVIGTPISKIYERIRKICGKPARKINILKTGETLYSSTIAIANCQADSFAAVASTTTQMNLVRLNVLLNQLTSLLSLIIMKNIMKFLL